MNKIATQIVKAGLPTLLGFEVGQLIGQQETPAATPVKEDSSNIAEALYAIIFLMSIIIIIALISYFFDKKRNIRDNNIEL